MLGFILNLWTLEYCDYCFETIVGNKLCEYVDIRFSSSDMFNFIINILKKLILQTKTSDFKQFPKRGHIYNCLLEIFVNQ